MKGILVTFFIRCPQNHDHFRKMVHWNYSKKLFFHRAYRIMLWIVTGIIVIPVESLLLVIETFGNSSSPPTSRASAISINGVTVFKIQTFNLPILNTTEMSEFSEQTLTVCFVWTKSQWYSLSLFNGNWWTKHCAWRAHQYEQMSALCARLHVLLSRGRTRLKG